MAGLEFQIDISRFAEDGSATIASLDPFEVIFQGQQVGAINATPNHAHIVGDPVRVLRYGQQLMVYATRVALPRLGVVTAYTTGTENCVVASGSKVFPAQIIGPNELPVGTRVMLIWAQTDFGPAAFAIKRGATVADPSNPLQPPDGMNVTDGPDLPTPPPPATGPESVTVLAQQTATFDTWTGKLYTADQGRYWLYAGYTKGSDPDPLAGAWFYGDQVSSVSGATVSKVELWVKRASGVGSTSAKTFHLWLHNNKTRPANYGGMASGGASPLVDYFALSSNQSAWVTLPKPWGQKIADGTAAGVGIDTVYGEEFDPYRALIGIDHPDATKRSTQSGALRFTLTRS